VVPSLGQALEFRQPVSNAGVIAAVERDEGRVAKGEVAPVLAKVFAGIQAALGGGPGGVRVARRALDGDEEFESDTRLSAPIGSVSATARRACARARVWSAWARRQRPSPSSAAYRAWSEGPGVSRAAS
jgi:hypothetical protein